MKLSNLALRMEDAAADPRPTEQRVCADVPAALLAAATPVAQPRRRKKRHAIVIRDQGFRLFNER